MAGVVSLATGGVVDPRIGDEADFIGTRRDSTIKQLAPPNTHGHNTIYLDASIPFESYHYYANLARAYERTLPGDNSLKQLAKVLVGKKIGGDKHPHGEISDSSETEKVSEDPEKTDIPSPITAPVAESAYGVTEEEWERAQRQTRTATWITIFYLITTDILGPYNVPWAISQMGYGPGIALYIVFGAMAFYSGLQLWRQFTGLDSPRYPMRNYGDLGFRLFGNWARLIINILQSCQFFMNVTLLIESNGQGLQQMAGGKNGTGVLCFVAAEIIFMVLGFILGQIRTLQRLGYLANLAVWLNVFVIFMTMAVVPIYGPNEVASNATYGTPLGEKVYVSAYWPPNTGLTDHINGLMTGVFAYGGATLFVELMAELRRPMDFWKAFVCAEIFIFSVYVTMGLVVYSYQGQYTFTPAYQSIPISGFAWQTIGNAVSFVSGLIAALLYGNIGVKVFYAAVLRDGFNFPPLDSKTGKWIWAVTIPIYWSLAFILAAAIPQIAYLTSFTGAAFILQFSYTFPPILMVAFNVQKDAMLSEEEFDPTTNTVRRVDMGFKRILRGYRKRLFLNTFDTVYFVAALATAGLGLYAAGVGMQQSFSKSKLTSFSCGSPTGSG